MAFTSLPNKNRMMSMQSQTIGAHFNRAISATIVGRPSEAEAIINEGEEIIREQYCKIFDLQNSQHKNDPNWWKQEFENAGKLLVDSFEKKDGQLPLEKFNIAFNGKMYEFNDKRVITVGRYVGCDVQFPNIGSSSRLNALIFLFPESEKYVVADMGSYWGIKTEKRSSGKPCANSLQKARNILIFDWTETTILTLGDMKIGINPKECVVCLTDPRNCVFDCGHYIVCNGCRNHLHECPICRLPINSAKNDLRIETFLATKK